jgi:hypothetical protein
MNSLSTKVKIIWFFVILIIGLIVYAIMNFSMYSFKHNPHTHSKHYYFIKELKDKNLTTINNYQLLVSSLAFYKNKNACGIEEPKNAIEVKCLVISVEGATAVDAKSNAELLMNNLKNNISINSKYSGLDLVIFSLIRMNNYAGGTNRNSIYSGDMKLSEPYRIKFGN